MPVSFSRWYRPFAAAAALVLASAVAVPAALAGENEGEPTTEPTTGATQTPEVNDGEDFDDPSATPSDEASLPRETNVQEEGGVGETSDEDFLISPMAIPTPSNSQSVVTIKVGGYRTGTGTNDISPLAGATLGLFDTAGAMNPFNGLTCVSDADGDCSFVIPNTNQNGSNRDRTLWVKAISAPEGYHIASQLGTGTTPSTSNYAFRVGDRYGNLYLLRGGQTYRSTVNFMYRSDDNSSGSHGIFQYVRDNPVINQCGLDIAMVFDLSGSVNNSQDQLAAAANSFVDALTGTDSSVSLYTFSTGSPATVWSGGNTTNVIVPNHPVQQSVSTPQGANTVKSWYSDPSDNTATFTPSGGTNWDRGLYAPVQSGNSYEVAIVFTDGNPTFYGNAQGPGSSTGFKELESGIFSANALKNAGTRVIAVGVGSGVTSTVSGLNLASISGPEKGSDYFQTPDYAEAAEVLRSMIADQCAGNITVVKQVVDADTTGEDITGATPTGGWAFDATSSNPSAPFQNGSTSASGVTSEANGAIEFSLDFTTPNVTTDVTITEQQKDGYDLVTQEGDNAVCTDLGSNTPVDVVNVGEFGFKVEGVVNTANISCVVYNRPPVPTGSLQLIKSFDLQYGGSDSTEPWTLTATRDDDEPLEFQSGETIELVEPGDYVIGEFYGDGSANAAEAAGFEHVSTQCTIDGEPTSLDANGAVQVAAGTDVVCELLNADLPGSVEWLKVSTSGNDPLAGSEWTLTGPGIDEGSPALILDCTEATCVVGEFKDQDEVAGQFRLESLSWGDYTLTESKAPPGYALNTTPIEFTIGVGEGQQLNVVLDSITNTSVDGPELPLTGGIGRDFFIIAGLVVLGLGAAAATFIQIRRRRGEIS